MWDEDGERFCELRSAAQKITKEHHAELWEAGFLLRTWPNQRSVLNYFCLNTCCPKRKWMTRIGLLTIYDASATLCGMLSLLTS